MRSAGICVVAVLVLQSLLLEAAYCADRSSPTFSEEVSKQERIYRSRGEQVPEGYTIDRTLAAYTEALGFDFDSALADLGPGNRWLDIGAGRGQAILDYYAEGYDLAHLKGSERRGTKAQSVAISIEDRRTPVWQQVAASLEANQIQYFINKRLREYSPEELGRFQIITDVIGGFSYAVDLSLFMEKVLGFLEVNGSFYTLLQDVHSEAGTNLPYYANAPFLTEIANADGSELKVCSWLKSISCVEVSCEFRARWRPPVESFRIRKICSDVRVPALAPVHYEAGTPPERGYRLRK